MFLSPSDGVEFPGSGVAPCEGLSIRQHMHSSGFRTPPKASPIVEIGMHPTQPQYFIHNTHAQTQTRYSELNLLLQHQPHIGNHVAPIHLRLAHILHIDHIPIVELESMTTTCTVCLPHRTDQLRSRLPASCEKVIGHVLVGVVAPDEAGPVSLNEDARSRRGVVPDGQEFADVRCGADVPSVCPCRKFALFGVRGGNVESWAVVANVTVHI
jgi:hypothetical protein